MIQQVVSEIGRAVQLDPKLARQQTSREGKTPEPRRQARGSDLQVFKYVESASDNEKELQQASTSSRIGHHTCTDQQEDGFRRCSVSHSPPRYDESSKCRGGAGRSLRCGVELR